MRKVPEIAVTFVQGREAYVGRVYDDAYPNVSLDATTPIHGRLTAGWGYTSPSLRWDTKVDYALAMVWLKWDLAEAAERLSSVVNVSNLTDQQYAALISFVFNCGCDPKWQIWKDINLSHLDQVPIRLMQFVNVRTDGELHKIAGLVNRRLAEIALWESGTITVNIPSPYTREAVTPPTPIDPKPITQSKSVRVLAASVVAGLPNLSQQIYKALLNTNCAERIWSLIGVVSFALICGALYLVVSHKKQAQQSG